MGRWHTVKGRVEPKPCKGVYYLNWKISLGEFALGTLLPHQTKCKTLIFCIYCS